jgi:hypothetical protein
MGQGCWVRGEWKRRGSGRDNGEDIEEDVVTKGIEKRSGYGNRQTREAM